MLRAPNWARLLYIAWSGVELLVLLLTSPVKPMLIPGILMYAVSSSSFCCVTFWQCLQTTKNIFGRSTLALSAFFFYVVNILAFVN